VRGFVATVFAWLRVVGINEAYRLCAAQRVLRVEELDHGEGWDALIADRHTIDNAIEARRALGRLAELPNPECRDLTLRVAGFSYVELAHMTGGRTCTNVNRQLVKARARIRHAELDEAGPSRGDEPLHG
jgi:hypothetical protein